MTDTITVLAPRWANSIKLGNYDAVVVRPLYVSNGNDNTESSYLVRFEDGHEAAAFRSTLLATARNWSMIDALDRSFTPPGRF